jgi:hypothetical protein
MIMWTGTWNVFASCASVRSDENVAPLSIFKFLHGDAGSIGKVSLR